MFVLEILSLFPKQNIDSSCNLLVTDTMHLLFCHFAGASPSQFSTSYEDDIAFGNRLKREFWYAIPPNKAYFIYHFLLKWSPEKYGQVREIFVLELFVQHRIAEM